MFLLVACSSGYLPSEVYAAGQNSAGISPQSRLIDFQQYRFGLPPTEFEYDGTLRPAPAAAETRPSWRTYVDLFAPSPKLVLIQSAAVADPGHYAIAAVRDLQFRRGAIAVSIKLLSGRLSESAGLFWNAQDRQNLDALLISGPNSQIHASRIRQGRPLPMATAPARILPAEWNSLELSIQDGHSRVWLNHHLLLELPATSTISPGRIGLITHADTVALFDDFYIQPGRERVQRTPPSSAQSPRNPVRDVQIRTTAADFLANCRTFSRGDTVRWEAKVYDQDHHPIAGVTIECLLLSPAGSVIGQVQAMTGSDGRALFSRTVPPDSLPGQYSILFKAARSAPNRETSIERMEALPPAASATFQLQ